MQKGIWAVLSGEGEILALWCPIAEDHEDHGSRVVDIKKRIDHRAAAPFPFHLPGSSQFQAVFADNKCCNDCVGGAAYMVMYGVSKVI